jgi:hypothetical protein
VIGYGLDDQGLIPGSGKVFVFSILSRQTLGLIYAMGTREWGGVKLTTHLHLASMSRMIEIYIHSPIRLHGVVFNLSTGTIYLTFTSWK